MNPASVADLLENTHETDSILDTPCLVWNGNISPIGYARGYIAGKLVNIHRVAYLLGTGSEIPDGYVVRHLCHNKGCINPDHLKVGTQAENMRDSVRIRKTIHKLKLDTDFIRLNQATGEAIRADKRPLADVSQEYGIGPNQVSRIRQNRVWRAEQ